MSSIFNVNSRNSRNSRLRSRRRPSGSGPLVYTIDDLYEEVKGVRRGRPISATGCIARCCCGFVLLIVIVFGLLVSKNPQLKTVDGRNKSLQAGKNRLAMLGGCNRKICQDLSVVTLLRNGEAHACKDYCWDQLEWVPSWTKSAQRLPATDLYGSFQQHGQCEKQQDLALKKQQQQLKDDSSPALIPRQASPATKYLPDYPSLIRTSLAEGTNLLLLGDSVMKQAFDVLPMVLPRSETVISYHHYAYVKPHQGNRHKGGLEVIQDCVVDHAKKAQNCVFRNATMSARYQCTCTSVSTLRWAYHNISISMAWGYGIEFENELGKKQSYGLDFNVIKEPLYHHLAKSATTVVAGFGVLPHHIAHKVSGYKEMLQFFREWIFRVNKAAGSRGEKTKKLIYRLTMPQHFHTQKAPSTYHDERPKRDTCVERATERHWSDVLTQETLGSTTATNDEIDVIDLFPIAADLGRYHSVKGGDCNQWCLGFDLFYTFWHAVGASVSLLTLKHKHLTDKGALALLAKEPAAAAPVAAPTLGRVVVPKDGKNTTGKVFLMDNP